MTQVHLGDEMKIIVAVKRVVDPYVKIRVKPDSTGVETQNLKMSMNPFDEIALEEALRIREKKPDTEIVLISVGSDATTETLRHGLALGADRAIWIKTNQSHCSLDIAKIVHKIASEEHPQLILMGKQSIDADSNQTPQMLAGILNWPQATFASSITLSENVVQVTREIDGGSETLEVQLPAVISADLRLNQPRYASLPNIMKAKSKPITCIELESMGLDLRQHLQVLEVSAPKARTAGIKVNSVQELLDKLRHEARIL